MQLGIENISFATSEYVLPLATLAAATGVEVGKFHVGIGQEHMSVPAADEDIVTMAATAAQPVLEGQDLSAIRTVLFATESGIDQSKAAGVYVHHLLGLDARCRVIELKQACYSATAALQMAVALVARRPEQKVLVIASDVARYDRDSSGEATQGAGAVAMLVSATPAVLAIEPVSGLHTADVMDFWRPNYRSTALVDGKYSVSVYMEALRAAWDDYREQGGHELTAFDRFCYHQPFTRLAVKAHRTLAKHSGELSNDEADAQIANTLDYNRQIGNTYTASVYIGLLSLLENAAEDLSGSRVGFFSYGSGSVAELFAGVVQPGYREMLRTSRHREQIQRRREIDHDTYVRLHDHPEGLVDGDHEIPSETTGPFRLAGIREHKRIYETVAQVTAPVDASEVGASPSVTTDSATSSL
ncbi:hydroxymethylglutaryl-CoA synthase [Labedella populi]|uniref:Hydroxymethylglutaryl-CoA synthase n=1 Tax=Labedella populi TaxID=2498850 RepID=A0A3S4A6I7_9MICO|nr:hydroxymethylglutaryl-CoA synthase [Labedella populi]RWZ61514.1 hydroxymethylglutaryl-CoA synthase [Labedella populi]